MILPVGTKVRVTEGDTIRKKGSIGYVSSFIPTRGAPCIDTKQLVVFTRLGKKGKNRLVIMPITNQIVNYEDVISGRPDRDLIDKVSVMHGIRSLEPSKFTKWRSSRETKIEVLKEESPIDLTNWHWIDFFAYVMAELLHLDNVGKYYHSATRVGPYRLVTDANMVVETMKSRRLEIPHPAQHGGLIDNIKGPRGGYIRVVKTLMRSIDKDGEYNMDYLQSDFTHTPTRRIIMEALRKARAMSVPALKFYRAYLEYYRAISLDFVDFVSAHYQARGHREELSQIERHHPDCLNKMNDALFSSFAIEVASTAQDHGRDSYKYVGLLPNEVVDAEIISSSPIIRHRLGRRPQERQNNRGRRERPRVRSFWPDDIGRAPNEEMVERVQREMDAAEYRGEDR